MWFVWGLGFRRARAEAEADFWKATFFLCRRLVRWAEAG